MINDNLVRIGVAVCVLQDNKILLGRRLSKLGNGLWSVSGGHLEPGEEILDCARRELHEETGLHATEMHVSHSGHNVIDGNHYLTHYVFVYSFTGTLENREPHKCEGWHWFCDSTLPEPLFPTVAALFQQYGSIISFSQRT